MWLDSAPCLGSVRDTGVAHTSRTPYSHLIRTRPHTQASQTSQAAGPTHADGVRDTVLVVRMVSTVGNYDYLTEFTFHTDGSIEAAMTFAGYCEVRAASAAA